MHRSLRYFFTRFGFCRGWVGSRSRGGIGLRAGLARLLPVVRSPVPNSRDENQGDQSSREPPRVDPRSVENDHLRFTLIVRAYFSCRASDVANEALMWLWLGKANPLPD